MRLVELFGDEPAMSIGDRLQQSALDILTPLLAHKVPFITMQNVIDELRATRPGILVDRALVMTLLDPDTVKAVSKIEGDRIYLTPPDGSDPSKTSEDDAQDNIEKTKQNAIKQAAKDTKAAATPPPPPPPPPG